jgi:hypothetical protein
MVKTLLPIEEIDAQSALELPDRHLLSHCTGVVNVCVGSVTISNVLNNNTVTVNANVCGVLSGAPITCTAGG